VILLFGCVAKLEVNGVQRSASARAFQPMKEHWILLNGLKVMII